MVTGVDHITINIKDRQQSIRFYGEFLGLKRLADVDMEDHRLTYFDLGGSARLELIEYFEEDQDAEDQEMATETGKATKAGKATDPGSFRHLALAVSRLEPIAEEIQSYGGRVIQPPRWVENLQFTGMLAEDPNGCELEFVKRIDS